MESWAAAGEQAGGSLWSMVGLVGAMFLAALLLFLVVRALLGTEHSPAQMGAGTLSQETPAPEDEEAIDPSLLEGWDEFMARRERSHV